MLKIREDVNLEELEKFGFKKNHGGYVYYPINNSPSTRYFSAIKIDNDDHKDSWLCRTLCFKLENVGMWCNDLEQLELDIENIKNSYIAFKQKVKELLEADLIVEVEIIGDDK